ncbi:MAG: hypothetical protein EOM12_13860 [Verrucomicrobiae bacterium]|nr:hypothetical protein [Verrucomicrobiae bacterium]
MHVYFATSSKLARMGSFTDCLSWANERLAAREAKIVKIFQARPNEKNAPIIGEVTKEGYFRTPGGRSVYLAQLKKALKDGEEEADI